MTRDDRGKMTHEEVRRAADRLMDEIFKRKKPLYLKEAVAKEVTVPGGSKWRCAQCGKSLVTGVRAVKKGQIVYCLNCIKAGR